MRQRGTVVVDLERNATCGRPLRKGKCRVHGDEIHQSFTEHHRPTGGSK
jgi:hypothetical protein